MKRFAVIALKGLGWLLLAAVLLFLSWAAFNNKWVDAKPQAVPERLQARAPSVAAEKNAFFGVLALKYEANAEPWRCNTDKLDCVDKWASQHEALAALLQKDSEWGERCAALTEPGMGFEEPLPDFSAGFAKLNSSVTPQQNFFRCARWLQVQAVVAAERKQLDQALMRLNQADRFVRMQLTGSNSLISHALAWANARLQWHTVAALAARHPQWAAEQAGVFSALLRPLPEEALVPNRWASYEAAYGRAASASIQEGCQDPELREKRLETESKFERWLSCDSGVGFMLNATVQEFDASWGRALDQAAANANSLRPRFATESSGDTWRWRNSIGHMLFSVAEGAWDSYPRKQADVELIRQTAAVALQLNRIPGAERAAWLKAHPVDAALRDRIGLEGSQLIARSWQEPNDKPEFRIPLAPS